MFIYNLRFSNPAYNMLYLIMRISDSQWRSLEERLDDEDISLPQFRLLTVLRHHDKPLTPAELSRCVFRESQTITFTLNDLRKKGYIERLPDHKDKRLVKIQINESGKQLLKKHDRWIATTVSEITSCFSTDEFKLFGECLNKLQEKVFQLSGIDLVKPLDEFDGRINTTGTDLAEADSLPTI